MILVTGGTGLVGAHLLFDLVKSGKRVRAIRRSEKSIQQAEKIFSFHSEGHKQLFSEIEWVEGDVTDIYSLLEAMNGVEYVYHCAGMISYNAKETSEMMKVNIEGTSNVVNACLEKGIKKLCHVSSVAAFGTSERGNIISENIKWKSSPHNSNYDISKYGGEREVWRGAEEGLSVVIVNPSIILGTGNWEQGSPQLFHTVYKGLKIYSTGSAGFVDAKDVSKAMILLMESEIKNQRFILSSENHLYKFFLEKTADALGKSRPKIKVGKFLTAIGWRIDKLKSAISGKPHLITKEIARGACSKSFYSSEKMKQQLGFEFTPVEKSIKEVAKTYLSEKSK